MKLWFRWGAPRQVKHMTHSVWATPETIYLVGCHVRGMYGVGFGDHFFGVVLCDAHDAMAFEQAQP